MAKPGYVYDLVTPKGRLLYPSVDAPATGGQYSSGKYEVTLIFPKTEVEGHAALIKAAHDAAAQVHPKLDLSSLDIALRDGDAKGKAIMSGHWVMKCKSSRQPIVVNGRRDVIAASDVRHGDVGRLLVSAGFYAKGLDPVTADVYRRAGVPLLMVEGMPHLPGVTYYLNKVQWVAPNDGTIAPLGNGANAFPEEADDEVL